MVSNAVFCLFYKHILNFRGFCTFGNKLIWHFFITFFIFNFASDFFTDLLNLLLVTVINSWLSKCSTARGSGTGLYLVGPTKVGAHKSFLFTEVSHKVEN